MHKQPKHAGRNRDRECISWVVRGMVRGSGQTCVGKVISISGKQMLCMEPTLTSYDIPPLTGGPAMCYCVCGHSMGL